MDKLALWLVGWALSGWLVGLDLAGWMGLFLVGWLDGLVLVGWLVGLGLVGWLDGLVLVFDQIVESFSYIGKNLNTRGRNCILIRSRKTGEGNPTS